MKKQPSQKDQNSLPDASSELLNKLSPERRALLAMRLSQKAEAAAPPEPLIPRRDKDASAPASFAQQRLWFIDQLEPGVSAYNIPLPMRVRGALDLGILERCINEIRRRHEVLRTTFQTVDGSPVQIISEFEPIKLEVVELEHLPEAEGEAQARVMAAEERRRS